MFLLTPPHIELRRIENPLHPRMNSALLKKLLKDSEISRNFTEENEIVNSLRILREKLYVRFDEEIRKYERCQLLAETLNLLDNLYGLRMVGILHLAKSTKLTTNEYAQKNIEINEYIGLVGKSLERILECSLGYDGFSKNIHSNPQNIMWLLELGTEIVMVNQVIEEVVGLWHRGNLHVDRNGWNWKLMPEDQKRHDRFTMKRSLFHVQKEREVFGGDNGGLDLEEYLGALQNIDNQAVINGSSKLGNDDEEFIVTINEIHKRHYGHKYSERLRAILALGSLPKALDRDWFFEDEIVNYLNEKLGFHHDITISILNSLCLDGDLIKSEHAQPFEFRRKFRLIRRPIPKVKIGNRTAYYLTMAFLARSFLHIQAEYSSGSHPELEGTDIEKGIKTLNQRYADYFVRERVYPIFKNNGFSAKYHVENVGNFDLTDECGEIDILAFDCTRHELIVGECKHRVAEEINVTHFRREIGEFNKPNDGFVDRLKRKATWVENHKKDVLLSLNLNITHENVKCTPIFITNFYCPASEFVGEIEFVTEPELDSWCKQRTGDNYPKSS
jgi:hypothetical protein